MHFGVSTWFLWAIVLIIQNFAFTFVSRARNSGSLKRHMIASVFSNGVWFLSQIIIFEQLYKVMKGDYGWKMGAFTAVFYTVFTMVGSIVSHWWALKNEKGKARIGAYKDVATFTKAEGDQLRDLLKAFPAFFNEQVIRNLEYDEHVGKELVSAAVKRLETPLNGVCTN